MSRLRANQITNENANGAPNFPHGLTVTGIVTASTLNQTPTSIVVGSAVTANSQGIDVTGIVTATSFKGAATNLTSIPAANLTGTAAAINGSNITNLNASNVSSGIVTSARLGGGTASATTFLNGHGNFASAGSWTKIASGSGPASSVTSITIDNIFSDSYTFYKIWYHWQQDDWMKARYINADGSEFSSSAYGWTGQYAADNADAHSRFGNVNTDYMVFHYWDAADNSPAIVEITLSKPYSSSIETNNFWTGMTVHGTQIFTQQGANSDYTTGSRRGIKFYGHAGDAISSSNFHYLVLGAN